MGRVDKSSALQRWYKARNMNFRSEEARQKRDVTTTEQDPIRISEIDRRRRHHCTMDLSSTTMG